MGLLTSPLPEPHPYPYGDWLSLLLGALSILLWCCAEMPQVAANLRAPAGVEDISLAFVFMWAVGDIFNLVGCIVNPVSLPTQFVLSALYTGTTLLLLAQRLLLLCCSGRGTGPTLWDQAGDLSVPLAAPDSYPEQQGQKGQQGQPQGRTSRKQIFLPRRRSITWQDEVVQPQPDSADPSSRPETPQSPGVAPPVAIPMQSRFSPGAYSGSWRAMTLATSYGAGSMNFATSYGVGSYAAALPPTPPDPPGTGAQALAPDSGSKEGTLERATSPKLRAVAAGLLLLSLSQGSLWPSQRGSPALLGPWHTQSIPGGLHAPQHSSPAPLGRRGDRPAWIGPGLAQRQQQHEHQHQQQKSTPREPERRGGHAQLSELQGPSKGARLSIKGSGLPSGEGLQHRKLLSVPVPTPRPWADATQHPRTAHAHLGRQQQQQRQGGTDIVASTAADTVAGTVHEARGGIGRDLSAPYAQQQRQALVTVSQGRAGQPGEEQWQARGTLGSLLTEGEQLGMLPEEKQPHRPTRTLRIVEQGDLFRSVLGASAPSHDVQAKAASWLAWGPFKPKLPMPWAGWGGVGVHASLEGEAAPTLAPTPAPTPAPAPAPGPEEEYHLRVAVGAILGWAMACIYLTGRLPQVVLNCARGTVEGLSLPLFLSSLLGNVCYLGSILSRRHGGRWGVLWPNLPWLADSALCLVMDLVIFFQYIYFHWLEQQEDERQEDEEHYLLEV